MPMIVSTGKWVSVRVNWYRYGKLTPAVLMLIRDYSLFFAVQQIVANENAPDQLCFPADSRMFRRSEEHTSELQSIMRISYAVFCLKKKTSITNFATEARSTAITYDSHSSRYEDNLSEPQSIKNNS